MMGSTVLNKGLGRQKQNQFIPTRKLWTISLVKEVFGLTSLPPVMPSSNLSTLF